AISMAGFGYGLYLGMWAFIATGAGHGSYVLVGLFSSPLGLSQNIPIAMVSIPFLWCFIGFILGRVTHSVARLIFVLVMLTHYAALSLILRSPSEFADWERAWRYPSFLMGSIGFYLVGQVALWIAFVVILRKGKMHREETTP